VPCQRTEVTSDRSAGDQRDHTPFVGIFSNARNFQEAINAGCTGHYGRKIYAGSRGWLAEVCACGQNTQFFAHHFVGPSLPIFSIGRASKPHGVIWPHPPCLVPFCSTFITYRTKYLLFICRYVEPFRSYTLMIDDSPRKFEVNLRFFPSRFLGMGKKFFWKLVFSLDPTPNLCTNFVVIH